MIEKLIEKIFGGIKEMAKKEKVELKIVSVELSRDVQLVKVEKFVNDESVGFETIELSIFADTIEEIKKLEEEE